jgi:hypothetical protein
MKFRSYSFASLPSATYLFFPARQADADAGVAHARMRVEQLPAPGRVVVSTPAGPEAKAPPSHVVKHCT